MNKTDFSHLGGFPLTQDELDYLQQAYIACINTIAATGVNGSAPYVLTGMAVTGGGNTVADGWFVYGGELIKFTGSTVTPGAGEVALVLITDNVSTLVYNDASVFGAHHSKTATLTHAATVTDASHFPVSALLPFGTGFGLNNREQTWSSLAVSTLAADGGVTGTIYYKKDFTANALQIRGFLTANNAQNFAASPAALYYTMGTLPAGYIPNNNAYFTAYYFIAGLLKDDLGVAWVKQINCAVISSGQIYVNWIRPDATFVDYSIDFNAIIPLD